MKAAVGAELEIWRGDGSIRRLWAGDKSLWAGIDEDNWVGWLHIVEREMADLDRLRGVAEQVNQGGFTDVILLGMGGSSLGHRLTRSLADFAKLVQLFDAHNVSFVSVTQSFNTTTSMGRLTLNVLLSFAQFEREVTGERIRDKIAASKKKGMWMGGVVPLGYRVEGRALHIVEHHAELVRDLFRRYLEAGAWSG